MSSENTPRRADDTIIPRLVDTGKTTRQLRRATQQASAVGTSSFVGQRGNAADPFGNETAFRTAATGLVDQLAVGVIVDGSALSNCYRVQIDHSTAPVMATAVTGTGQGCIGATEINSYMPGTRVLVVLSSRAEDAIIIGGLASYLETQRQVINDYISPMSRTRVDDAHKKYLKMENSSGQSNFNCGRALDGTHASEWGAITSTGIGVTLDDFMVRMSVNEICGIYGFYHDSMLRVAGYNLQVWTAGHEREAINDQGEYNDYQGYTPYPWENQSMLEPARPSIKQYEPENYLSFKGQPYYARWENSHEFAQPFHRTITYYGYLGQGGRHIVQCPPEGVDQWTYDTQTGPEGETPFDSQATDGDTSFGSKGPTKDTDHKITKPALTVAEQQTQLDGRLTLASSTGIILTKRLLLPATNRRLRPENSEEGDDVWKNYRAADLFGRGPAHNVRIDGPTTTDRQYPMLQYATAIMDMHGYVFNYLNIHPFYWHEKDYKTWEQSEYEFADVVQKAPKFSELAGSMVLDVTEPKLHKLDHRNPKTSFYEAESYINMAGDGSILIGDGYGAEIRMTGGCIFLSAPGDVWIKSGRDTQTWAGNDVILRANKSADISANENSVRIKAEKHLMLMGGNEDAEYGGVMVESRTKYRDYDFNKAGDLTKFSGIVLRAPKGNVVSEAKYIYLRTGSEDGEAIENGGHIYIDSQTGDGDIITRSKNYYVFCDQSGAIFNFFGDPEDVDKSNYFTKDITALAGRLIVEQDAFINGGVLTNGTIIVGEGHIATEGAERASLMVGPLDGEAVSKVKEALEQLSEIVTEKIPDMAQTIYFAVVETQWYDALRAGNEDVLNLTCFSFRTDDDYKIGDLMLYEDRWQHMARIAGQTPEKWDEKEVKVKTDPFETYCFPGKKFLKEEPIYAEQDLKITEYVKGGFRNKDRGQAPGLVGDYKEPEFKPPEKKILNDNYPIIPRE